MRKGFIGRFRFLACIIAVLIARLLVIEGGVGQAAIVPPVGLLPLNQAVVPEPTNLYEFVKNKSVAIMLGKAFFWDMQVGSDGKTACATCHFSAGTDKRLKNTMNPGINDGDVTFQSTVARTERDLAANRLSFSPEGRAGRIPGHRPLSVMPTTSSAPRAFASPNLSASTPAPRVENGTPLADPVFQVGGVNTRQVTGRNTPSVINAVFNFTNFWDGRASAFFNGVNPFGPLDQTAGVWFNVKRETPGETADLDGVRQPRLPGDRPPGQ